MSGLLTRLFTRRWPVWRSKVRSILETGWDIRTSARSTDVSRRLIEIAGVGPLLASALRPSVAESKAFKRGRSLAAWGGLVPRSARLPGSSMSMGS